MKITTFYYLSYPNSEPADELVASSEVYVEVSATGGDNRSFDDTYALFVHTVGYIQSRVDKFQHFTTCPALIVERFNDVSIRAALEAILPGIDSIATRK